MGPSEQERLIEELRAAIKVRLDAQGALMDLKSQVNAAQQRFDEAFEAEERALQRLKTFIRHTL